jgi:serine phosphatase RsbU (regulator of sigma subunit)
VRASAKYELSPAALLSRLNEAIIQNIVENSTSKTRPWANARLCTAAIIRLDRNGESWSATASSAGHPIPLLRHADGSVQNFCQPGLLLGVLENPPYVEAHLDLDVGATLVLYTDGVSERHLEAEMFGSDGIIAALRGANSSADQVGELILTAALRFGTRREDDLVVLTVRV